ncbi:MAG TPA: FAD-dependent oxidoreductase [Candidatus Eisenbacteria bacterium]|nr:FAD-dependent oxidoreductase [Candidatus Eisenbacteria bacterium]
MTVTTADLVVVGAGVMGAWTALRALEDGRETLLVDAFGPGDARATSSEASRLSRASHGTDEWYTRSSRLAREDWIALGEETGEALFIQTGVAWFGHREDGFEAASLATLASLGIPVERLTPDEAGRRWPAVASDDLAFVVHEPEAGVLRAARGVAATVGAFERRGGHKLVARVRPGRTDGQRLLDVVDDPGNRFAAGAFVFAAGPWLPRLFPDQLAALIAVTKQDVLYFGPATSDTRFEVDRFPAWVDYDRAFYGSPALDGHGPKAAPDAYGRSFDPDAEDRLVDRESIDRTREYLRQRLPDLADRPVVESRVCQYESTPDTHFVIDRHPYLQNVWLVGGGSGHGFKHGPQIGRHVVELLNGRTFGPEDGRFALQRSPAAGPALRSGGSTPRSSHSPATEPTLP